MKREDEALDKDEITTTRKEAETLIREAKERSDAELLVRLTHHEDESVRVKAIRASCPCKTKDDVCVLWDRILELKDDESAHVRSAVLHTLCDGSPSRLERDVEEVIDGFTRDSDKTVRRQANKVMASVLRGGGVNVL